MVLSTNNINFTESDIQKSLALLACYTGSIHFQIEPIFEAKEGSEATTRRLDLLYVSPDKELVVGIEVKKNRISGEDMFGICVKKAYPEILKTTYPDKEIILIITNKITCGISPEALYMIEHFKFEGVTLKYLPVESIGESLFQEFVDNRPMSSAWYDNRLRNEYSICLSK